MINRLICLLIGCERNTPTDKCYRCGKTAEVLVFPRGRK